MRTETVPVLTQTSNKSPVSFLLLGVLAAFVFVRAAADGDWWFVGAVAIGSIHQTIVSIEWRHRERARLRGAADGPKG